MAFMGCRRAAIRPAATCLAACADPGLAFGEIRVLVNLPVRAPEEF